MGEGYQETWEITSQCHRGLLNGSKPLKKSSVAYFFAKFVVPILTSGGPASFIMPLQIGKVPIVVPRQRKFDEHVNDHQVEFARNVAERMGNIILVEDIEDLKSIIENYDSVKYNIDISMKSNNTNFCKKINKIVYEILKEKD